MFQSERANKVTRRRETQHRQTGRAEKCFQLVESTSRHAFDLCCSETEIQLCRSCLMALIITRIPAWARVNRHTGKNHDSVVEVNIAWEEHITIILSGGFKSPDTFSVFFHTEMSCWNNKTELPIIQTSAHASLWRLEQFSAPAMELVIPHKLYWTTTRNLWSLPPPLIHLGCCFFSWSLDLCTNV